MIRRSIVPSLCLAVGLIGGTVLSAEAGPTTPRFHVVARGETWASVAATYQITAASLRQANNVPGSSTAAMGETGRHIFVPAAGLPVPTTTTVRPTTTVPAPTTTVRASTTTVRPTTTVAATTTTARATTTTVQPTTTVAAPTTTVRPTTTTSAPVGVMFSAGFATEADFRSRFATQVWHRNLSPNDGGIDFRGGHDFSATWSGDHDMACAGPGTQRTVHGSADGTDPEAFWWCAPAGPDSGHVMTSMGPSDGYSIVAFAPNQSFTNLSRVCWDVNLTDLGIRKWPEMTIVPEADFQANGGSMAWHSSEANVYTPGTIAVFQQNSVARFFVNGQQGDFDGRQLAITDKAARYRHCLTDNGNGTLTFTQARPAPYGQLTATIRGQFPDQGRVIFSDHSYVPEKDGAIIGFTWHWDAIEIS